MLNMLKQNNPSQYLDYANSIIPLVKECLPEHIKTQSIANLFSSYLGLADMKFTDFAKNIAYEDNKPINPFTYLKNLCDFVGDKENANNVKKLLVCLSLSSKNIIEKKIDIKIEGIDFSKSIQNCLNNNFTFEDVDKILNGFKFFIENFLNKSISEIELKDFIKSS